MDGKATSPGGGVSSGRKQKQKLSEKEKIENRELS
jgi:hypothetical protein